MSEIRRGNPHQFIMKMPQKYYDIAFIIPLEPRFFSLTQMFLRTTRSHFTVQQLPEVQIFGWVKGGSLRVILRFDAVSFEPVMLSWFQSWVQALNAEMIELENLDSRGRNQIIARIKMAAEVIYTGSYDIERAVEDLKTRFIRTHGTRKQPRFSDRLKVLVKTVKDSIGEHTENISFGGMFVRGETNLPPRSRVEVSLELPGMRETVNVIAEVVHVQPPTGGSPEMTRPAGSGFQFVEFINDGEAKLRKYIRKNLIGNQLVE